MEADCECSHTSNKHSTDKDSVSATSGLGFARDLRRFGRPDSTQVGWSRIVLEKPLGRDLDSARELNRTVLRTFDESNIYRIDQYLGKETVQNILVFRFGNSLFEPVWNRNYVDYVEITAAETVGVENRASFYEETGALRDMVANHMLQLIALTAMEPPIAFEADAVREQKVQVFRSIHPMTVEEVARRTVRGQYGPGEICGTCSVARCYRNPSRVSAVPSGRSRYGLRYGFAAATGLLRK